MAPAVWHEMVVWVIGLLSGSEPTDIVKNLSSDNLVIEDTAKIAQ